MKTLSRTLSLFVIISLVVACAAPADSQAPCEYVHQCAIANACDVNSTCPTQCYCALECPDGADDCVNACMESNSVIKKAILNNYQRLEECMALAGCEAGDLNCAETLCTGEYGTCYGIETGGSPLNSAEGEGEGEGEGEIPSDPCSCDGKECGDNGCGGTCGICPQAGQTCSDEGQCTGGSTGTGNGTGNTAPGDCTREGFTAVESKGQADASGPVFLFSATSSTAPPMDIVLIQSYQGASYNGPSTPGSFPLAGSNYEDCGLCLLAFSDCQDAGGQNCGKTYFADEGILDISQIGGDGTQFAATMKGVVFKEVTIDWNSTYKSTPVPGGARWCMEGVTVGAAIEGGGTTAPGEFPVAEAPAETECVAAGNGSGPALVGQNVGDFELTNCNGDKVSFHASCGNKAMWVMSTAEWCTACTAQLQGIAQTMNGYISKENMPEGLDMWIVLYENASYGKPSQQLCQQYATQKKIDPAMLFVDWADAKTQVPLVSPAGSAIETNGMAAVWNKINPYLAADSQGRVSSFTPWHAILRGTNMEHVWSSFYDQNGDPNAHINQLLAE